MFPNPGEKVFVYRAFHSNHYRNTLQILLLHTETNKGHLSVDLLN